MECIEARALKSSFLSEKSTTHFQQFDEFWCVAGINNVVNSEDFSVDDLLDLSDKDFVVKNNNGSEEDFQDFSEEDEEKDSISVSSRDNDVNSNSSSFSGDGIFGPLPAGELIVPAEDEMENLEWLSQIVDDSVTEEMSLLCPAGTFKDKTGRTAMNRFIPVPKPVVIDYSVLGFSYPVPRKARSQRSRPSRRVWPIGSFSLVDSSSSSSSSFDSSVTSPVLFTNPVQVMDSFWAFGKPPTKKQKKNRSIEAGGESVISGSQMQRRCSHCLVQKTPQWRTGPLGPKTLCNACGVRFKSGRLFPEYRPACSPTFSVEAHSNSHRKVLEMRRKKEVSEMGSMMMNEPGLAPMVQSF